MRATVFNLHSFVTKIKKLSAQYQRRTNRYSPTHTYLHRICASRARRKPSVTTATAGAAVVINRLHLNGVEILLYNSNALPRQRYEQTLRRRPQSWSQIKLSPYLMFSRIADLRNEGSTLCVIQIPLYAEHQ